MIVNFCSAKATLHKKFWGTMQVEQRGLLEGVIFLTREKKVSLHTSWSFASWKNGFTNTGKNPEHNLTCDIEKKDAKNCEGFWTQVQLQFVYKMTLGKKAKIIFVPCSTSCRIVQLFQTQVCFNIPHTKNNLFHWKDLKNVAIFWSNGKVNESIS